MNTDNLNKVECTINAGADKPFTVLHITDTHLTYADERDGERKVELAKKRIQHFPDTEEKMYRILDYGAENCDLIINTGDLIDFVSQKNLEVASELDKKYKFRMAAGNHEYSLYVGEAKEDEAYKAQSFDKVQAAFRDDLRFQAGVVNGVNIITLDNVYYYIRQREFDLFKKEVEKGLPIILCVHNPFYEESLYEFAMRDSKYASIVGCPEEKLSCYPPERAEQQRPDKVTLEFIDYLATAKNVKAIIAGHLHWNFESVLPCGIRQYVTGLTCEGFFREIKII